MLGELAGIWQTASVNFSCISVYLISNIDMCFVIPVPHVQDFAKVFVFKYDSLQ